jgi:hypothetical protein
VYCNKTVNTTTYQVELYVSNSLYLFEYRYIAVNANLPFDFIIINNFNVGAGGTGTGKTTTGTTNKLASSTSNYQVIFYLTCLSYPGTNAPVFNVTGKVTSSTSFTITYSATFGIGGFLHGSVIIFDSVNLKNSGVYSLTYGTFLFNTTVGGEIPVPI